MKGKKKKVSVKKPTKVDNTIPKPPKKKKTRRQKVKPVFDHLILFKKRYSLGFILLIAIIISIVLYFVISSQFHFVLNDEIVITHDPRLSQSIVLRNDTVTFNFSVHVDQYKRCESICQTQIVNLLDNETVTFSHNASGTFASSFQTPEKGLGHFFLHAKTSCINTKTFFCPSTGKPFVQSSLRAVTYELTTAEKNIISNVSYQESLDEHHLALRIQNKTPSQFQTISLQNISQSAVRGISFWNSQEYVLAGTELSFIPQLEQVRRDYDLYVSTVSSYNNLSFQFEDSLTALSAIFDSANLTQLLFSQLRDIELRHSANAQNYTTNESLLLNYSQIISQIKFINTTSYLNLPLDLLSYGNSTNTTLLSCDDISQVTFYDCALKQYVPISFPKLEVANITQSQNPFVLEPVKPVCCQQGICTSCEEHFTPILFIHGHAFNADNTPENQMSSFAKLQNRLPYTNGGIVDIASAYDLSPNSYGKTTGPITFRGTYYYIDSYGVGDFSLTVQKSERIENYALRLRELIESVKYITGSEDVIIVAHSMGGLVAREYMNIFGRASVKKVITINTPHNGITGRVERSCSVFGASKECEDMIENSIFLKRISQIRDVSVIYSTGCDMQGVQGDGVVTETNGLLEGANEAILIEGNCTDTLQTSLHSDVLNPDLYPKIVPILTQLLS